MRILTTTSYFGEHDIPEKIELIRNPYGRRLSENELSKILEEIRPDAIIAGVEPLTRKVLEGKPYLKAISRCGAGLDNVDLEAAKSLGIRVLNTPDAPTAAVAEMTVALILSLIKKLNIADAAVRRGEWKSPGGNMLFGKTIGIIGCGRIGEYVSRLLTAFGCDIIGHDIARIPTGSIKPVEFDFLIGNADIISLHVPYSEKTRHIIGAAEIKGMKKSALLINTARGGLIDETALYDALSRGDISGAAIDCFEKEPYDGPLRELSNVILSPHMASGAEESRHGMEKEALENVLFALEAVKS
ncbi:MAG: phosphoglycerate dehydrogenase [Clostridia bacterium]|nr:phosphoglycerate dehydrogenase [Clostridia bacterium]